MRFLAEAANDVDQRELWKQMAVNRLPPAARTDGHHESMEKHLHKIITIA